MKRILFVDDERQILRIQRLAMRPYRKRWQSEFALGPDEALAALDQHPFDLVLTDMRMPGMDGAALLAIVRERCPGAVRLVQTGFADRKVAVRAAGLAHQVVAKPCDLTALRGRVARSIELASVLDNPEWRARVHRIGCLPSPPAAVSELASALTQPGSDAAALAAIVRRDPVLCAKLLQLVNSAFFVEAPPTVRIEDAIVRLGKELLATLVSCPDVVRSQPGEVVARLADHGAQVAEAARQASDPDHADAAFVAGAVHDIGLAVVAEVAPDKLDELVGAARASSCGLASAEERAILGGVTHSEIGAYLLGVWGLPEAVVAATRDHHAESAESDFAAITHAVAAADDCEFAGTRRPGSSSSSSAPVAA